MWCCGDCVDVMVVVDLLMMWVCVMMCVDEFECVFVFE